MEIYKDLYKGYIFKNNPNINQSQSLKKCIRKTSEKLNISMEIVEKNIYNISSISRISANFSFDEEIVKNLIHKFKKQSPHKFTEYYYAGPYIYDTKVLGSKKLPLKAFFMIAIVLLDEYKYIDPIKLEDHSYIMKLNNCQSIIFDSSIKSLKYTATANPTATKIKAPTIAGITTRTEVNQEVI